LPHAASSPGSIALADIWGCHDWLVLGFGRDPQAGLAADIAAKLRALHAVFVIVNGAPTCAGTHAMRTADPIFLDWAKRHAVRHVVVRPDRFILGQLGNGACARALSLVAMQSPASQPPAESLAA
jgi:3-(3-hydroxy-phenyl)propionate hydroxylase